MIRFLKTLFIVTSFLFFTSCSENEDDPSQDVTINLVNDSPLIIPGDLTFFPGTIYEWTATAPWFEFSYTITNDSKQILYLLNFELTTVYRKNGTLGSTKTTLNITANCQSGDSRIYLGIILPGETFRGMSACSDDSGSKVLPNDKPETWIVHGLPEADTTYYNVTVKPLGYFVPVGEDEASGRYSDQAFFVTQ